MGDDTEESKKVFWDNFSVLKTAEQKGIQKGLQQGVQKEKADTVRRLQSMGLTIEQIAQGADITVDDVRKILE